MRRAHGDQPLLITSAPVSNDDDFDRRRKRYAIMMGSRGVCVIAAACTYQISWWIAAAFIIGGTFLPWCAVLIANDGPPKKRQAHLGHLATPVERGLPGGIDDRTVDG